MTTPNESAQRLRAALPEPTKFPLTMGYLEAFTEEQMLSYGDQRAREAIQAAKQAEPAGWREALELAQEVICPHVGVRWTEEAAHLRVQAIHAINAALATDRAQAPQALAASVEPQAMGAEGQAARDVIAERQRQISAEGWTPEHDDMHRTGDLAEAASAYAQAAAADGQFNEDLPPAGWPWEDDWWKPGTPRRMLVKAGALILAEIDRLDRASPTRSQDTAA